MPDPRLEPFVHYVGLLQSKMRLLDWTIKLANEPPLDAGNAAEADFRYGRKILWVAMNGRLLESNLDEQRQVLVHELVHCHFEPLRRLMLETFHEDQYRAFKLLFEYGIDSIAEVIAPFMPLPGATNATDKN